MSGAVAGRRIGLLTAAASRLGGGVFEAVVAHAAMLRDLGAEPLVFALDDAHASEDAARLAPTPVRTVPVTGPPQIGFAPALPGLLQEAGLDLLHLHGIWMYPSRAGLLWARATGRPYVISPHGMLDPWITARGRWKKALARSGYERAGWQAACVLHALTGREANDIARESGRGDALVIPNPGPPPSPAPAQARKPLVLSIGRIHPKKNLLALVRGWRAARRPDGAELVIAGWGDAADVAQLQAEVADGAGGVRFIGPVFGAEKQALLDAARFVVLPSLSEGLPMAVLEAWAAGTPTVMTADCNLPEGFVQNAALACGHDPASIAAGLTAALECNDWQAMSGAALALATGPFSAAQVAARWDAAYGAMLEGTPPR